MKASSMEAHPATASPAPLLRDDEFVSKRELAARLKVNIRTIENRQRRGFLPYVKISRVVRFHWPDVVAHLKANFQVWRVHAGSGPGPSRTPQAEGKA